MFARDLVRVARAPLALVAAAATTAIVGTAAPAQADERKVITSSANKELLMEQLQYGVTFTESRWGLLFIMKVDDNARRPAFKGRGCTSSTMGRARTFSRLLSLVHLSVASL